MTGAHTSAAGVQLSEEQIHASLLSAVKDKLKRRALDVSSQGQVRHVIMGHKMQLSHGWLSQTSDKMSHCLGSLRNGAVCLQSFLNSTCFVSF